MMIFLSWAQRLRTTIFGVAFTLTFLQPHQAHAADSATEARLLYMKGREAFQKGDDVMAREYYKQSLAIQESVDTICNLGMSEGRSKLYADAYEHLRLCLYLIPADEEFEEARKTYATARDLVRREITFEEAHPIDERVDAEIERRERAAKGPSLDELPASGLDEPEPEADDSAIRAWRKKWTPAYIAGGVTVATFGTSMVFLSLVQKERKKIEAFADDKDASYCVDPNPGCEEQAKRIKRHDDYSGVTNGTLIASGVGAAATLGYVIYMIATKPKKESAVHADVSFGRTGGFVAVSGSF